MANELMDLQFYTHIKEILSSARAKVYSATNFAMVEAYWEIGKSIVEKQGGNATAEYGEKLIIALSKQMTADFGKGFSIANLRNMRQFYLAFQNRYTLCSELSWTHYRLSAGAIRLFLPPPFRTALPLSKGEVSIGRWGFRFRFFNPYRLIPFGTFPFVLVSLRKKGTARIMYLGVSRYPQLFTLSSSLELFAYSGNLHKRQHLHSSPA